MKSKWNKFVAHLHRVIPRFSPLISFLKFSPMRWRCVFCFFSSWSGDKITNSAYRNNLRIFAYFEKMGDVLDNVSKRVVLIVLTPQPFPLNSEEIFGCSLTRQTPLHVFSARIDAMSLQVLLKHCNSHPSRDEARRLHVHALLKIPRGHSVDDASRLCSLYHCMHWSWSWSAKLSHSLKNSLKTLMYT